MKSLWANGVEHIEIHRVRVTWLFIGQMTVWIAYLVGHRGL